MPTSRLLDILFQPCPNLAGFRGFLAKYLATAIAVLIDNWHSTVEASFFKVAEWQQARLSWPIGEGGCLPWPGTDGINTLIPPISSPSATSARWVAKHNRFYAPGSCFYQLIAPPALVWVSLGEQEKGSESLFVLDVCVYIISSISCTQKM